MFQCTVQIHGFHVYVVLNYYFQLNISFTLFLRVLLYGNVHKNEGKTRKKINYNIYTQDYIKEKKTQRDESSVMYDRF